MSFIVESSVQASITREGEAKGLLRPLFKQLFGNGIGFTRSLVLGWLLLFPAALYAATLSVPTTSSTGSYPVTWGGVGTVSGTTYSYGRVEIIEKDMQTGLSSTLSSYSYGASSGSVQISNKSDGTYTYTLTDCPQFTCQPPIIRSISVSVPVTATAAISPTSIAEGGTATLTWSSTRATSCSASGISGVSAPSGSATYTAPTVMSTNQNVTLSVTCTNGVKSGSANALISVVAVNDTPLLSLQSSASTSEDTPLSISFSTSDEETALTGLIVATSSSDQSVIANSGILINGSKNALTITPVANASGTAVVTVRITDASGAFVEKTVAVTVAAVNDAPAISAIPGLSVNEGVLSTGDINFTVTDVDTAASALTVTASGAPFTLGGSGNNRTISIQPSATAMPGSISVTVTVSDGAASASATFIVYINDIPGQLVVNPTSSTGIYTLEWRHNTYVTKITEAGYSSTDFAGDLSANGSKHITRPNGTYQYFLYECIYGSGGIRDCSTVIDTKTVVVQLPVPTVTASFSPVSINEGGTATLTWSSTNATHCSSSNTSLQPAISGTSGSVTYTAPSPLSANTTLNVTVSCVGNGSSGTTTAPLTLVAVNDSPLLSLPGSASTSEDTPLSIPFAASDEETALAGLRVTATSSNQAVIASSGIVVNSSNNGLTLTPVANASGTASVTVQVTDASGATVESTVIVTVAAVNDAPAISAITGMSINEGTPTTGPIAFTLSDVDTAASSLSVTATSNNVTLVPAGNITLGGSGAAGTISVQPAVNQLGTAVITVTVSDGSASSSTTFGVSINDIPGQLVVNPTSNTGVYTVAWRYNTSVTTITETGYSSTDFAGDLSANGSKQITRPNGTYQYFLYECIYGSGGIRDCSKVIDTKTVVVQLPVPTVTASISPATINEGGTATLTWSSTNATSCSSSNTSLQPALSGTSGSVTYRAASSLTANTTVTVPVSCVGNGSSATATAPVTLVAVNDNPVLSLATNASTSEDTPLSIPFTASDEETALAGLIVTAASSDPTKIASSGMVINSTKNGVRITPVANASGTAVVTLQVTDANGASVQKAVTVTIASLNDAPVISAIASKSINEGTATTGAINFTLSDIDTAATALTVSAASNNSFLVPNSHITLGGSGTARTISVQPAANQLGTAIITVTVSDGSATSSTTFSVSVIDIPAQLLVNPSSATGLYTVEWRYAGIKARMTELRDGHTYSSSDFAGDLTPNGAKQVARPNGTYSYFLKECYYGNGGILECADIAHKIMVVSIPISSSSSSSSAGAQLPGSPDESSTLPPTDIPGGPLFAGVVPGQFKVGESGAATYAIPLSVPEGVAGVTPQLSLGYNSQSGKGILGKGWGLDGLSSISRCRQTVAQDGKAKAISWSADDRFCLNGQRLMVVEKAYGEVGSKYKTEIDSGVLVTAQGGSLGHPDYFTVEAKDGSTSTYGNTPDSKLAGNNLAVATTTFSWGINRFEDSVKNKIDYVYEGDALTQQRVKEINYAYNGEIRYAQIAFEYTNLPKTSTSYVMGYTFKSSKRLAKINIYNFNADNSRSTFRNYKLDYSEATPSNQQIDNDRLQTVQECVENHCYPPTAFEWGDMQNDFKTDNVKTLIDISKVVDHKFANFSGKGKLDIVMVNNKYNYSDGDWTSFDTTVLVNYADGSAPTNIPLGRFTKSEFSNASLSTVLKQFLKTEIIDYNADGRSDLAVYSSKTKQWGIYLSTPEGNERWRLGLSQGTILTEQYNANGRKFFDINGDGLIDTVAGTKYRLLKRDTSKPDSSNNAYMFGAESTMTMVGGTYPTATLPSTSCTTTRTSFINTDTGGDFNGDGLIDFIGANYTHVSCKDLPHPPYNENYSLSHTYTVVSNGYDGTPTTLSVRGGGVVNPIRQVVDINGDGLSDLIMGAEAGVTTCTSDAECTGRTKAYQLNTGKGFATEVQIAHIDELYDTDSSLYKHSVPIEPQYLDFNQDGALDFIWFDVNKKSMQIKFWEGSTFGPEKTIATIDYQLGDMNTFMDVNADGHYDRVVISGKDKELRIYHGRSTSARGYSVYYPPIVGAEINGQTPYGTSSWSVGREVPIINAIIGIKNGSGAETKIDYGTLGSSGHYLTADVNLTPTVTYPGPGAASACPKEPVYVYENCFAATTAAQYGADSTTFYSRLNGGWPQLPKDGSANTLVTNNTAKGGPVLEVNGPMQIVTGVSSKSPTAGGVPRAIQHNAFSKVSYYYGEAHVQASGRGFLGFQTLKTIDEQSNITTITTYRQDFPYIGSPLTTSVFTDNTAAATLLSFSANQWNYQTQLSETSKTVYRPYLEKNYELSYSLETSNLLQTTTTDTVLDVEGYGNPTSVTVTTEGGGIRFVKKTTNEYYTGDWEKRMARLERTTVSTTRDAEQDSERRVRFEYHQSAPHQGLLAKEVVEEGTAQQLETTYTYDAYGNKSEVAIKGEVTAGVAQTRKTIYAYDQGRYLTSTTNDLQQTSVIISRNQYGSPTGAVDKNGVTAETRYDALGREYLRKDATGAWSRTDTQFCSTQVAGISIDCSAVNAKYFTLNRVAGGGMGIEYFDSVGRVVRSGKLGFTGSWSYVDTEYDNLSRVKYQSLPFFEGATPAGWTTYEYDRLGRLIKVSLPDGSMTHQSYRNYETTLTNALGQPRKETRNGLGQLVKVENALGGTITYTYTLKGELLTATTDDSPSAVPNVAPVTVRMCYDLMGRKIGMHDPDKGGYKGGANADCSTVANWKTQAVSGWWHYGYNAFGELTEQRDPNAQLSTLSYDIMGRMTARLQKFGNGTVDAHTAWFYDKPLGTAHVLPATKGKVTAVIMSKTAAAITDNSSSCGGANHCTMTGYDAHGRVDSTAVHLPDGQDHITLTSYDAIGRVSVQSDVLTAFLGQSGTRTDYNRYGYGYRTLDLFDGSLLRTITAMNERGQVTEELRGNGAISTYAYDPLTGLLRSQKATATGWVDIQSNTYVWDAVGNLTARMTAGAKLGSATAKAKEESFCYDGLNRLIATLPTRSPVCSGTPDLTYDGLGNITQKKGVGAYGYNRTAGGPHAVTSVNGSAYSYDLNGNVKSGDGRTFSYNSADMATTLTKGTDYAQFSYGPDNARWQRIDKKGSVVTTTTYLGNIERISVGGSNLIEWKRSVAGTVQTYKTIGLTLQANGTDKKYLYTDHLGSVDAITDTVGKVTHSMSFDAWGTRRSGEDWSAQTAAQRITSLTLLNFAQPITTRGYTGHEMVDEMGIVHMNGRIYDARIGRFLQADPFIQAATDTQSYNRYSYVLNNPLNATDPSGFFFDQLHGAIKDINRSRIRHAAHIFGKDVVYAAGSAASLACGPAAMLCSAAWSYEYSRAMGATQQQAIVAAAYSAGSTMIGQGLQAGTTLNLGQRMLVAGAINGVMAELQGGKFGHGFASAAMGQLGGEGPSGLIRAAIAGGTVSAITGGKFRNGAASAAAAFIVTSLVQKIGAGGKVDADTHSGSNSDTEKSQSVEEAKKILLHKGVISKDAAENIVDSTNKAALVPANVDETKITLADIKYVESWDEAQKLVTSCSWKNLDGMHRAGKINIYMSATKASQSVYLSRTRAMAITGSQNMIETIHHEYLHYIGLESHTSNSYGWGIRVRTDLGGWINEI